MIGRVAIPLLAVGLTSTASAQIVLERTSCFGWCAAYTLDIGTNGSVLFTGRNSFAVDSGHKDIAPTKVDSLIAQVMQSGFLDLADSYAQGKPGCRLWATDNPSIVLRVRRGSLVKAVSYDLGCNGDSLPQDAAGLDRMLSTPPASHLLIRRLAAMIDSVVGVAEWLRIPRLQR